MKLDPAVFGVYKSYGVISGALLQISSDQLSKQNLKHNQTDRAVHIYNSKIKSSKSHNVRTMLISPSMVPEQLQSNASTQEYHLTLGITDIIKKNKNYQSDYRNNFKSSYKELPLIKT